jgi:uncharacterized protein YbjT (DUF2867 family)
LRKINEMKNAMIVGATGLVGNELLQLLVKEQRYDKILLLVRRPLDVQDSSIVQEVINFDQIGTFQSPFPVDDVFCTLGTTIKTAGSQDAFRKVDFEYVVELGRWCKRNKVRQMLVVSAMGADHNSGIFYNRVKGEMEQALRNLDLPVTIFRPSLLMGNRKEHRSGEKMAQSIMGGLGFLFVGGLKKYKGIPGSTVAKAMIRVASEGTTGFKVLNSAQLW